MLHAPTMMELQIFSVLAFFDRHLKISHHGLFKTSVRLR